MFNPGPDIDAKVLKEVMGVGPGSDFSPTSNIVDAWRVIERLVSPPDSLPVAVGWNGRIWWATVGPDGHHSQTAGVAICVAALKAMHHLTIGE